MVFGAVLFGGVPAASQAVDILAEKTGEINDDIRQFCSNIVDAARDRRYAIQRSELEALREDVNQRIAAMEEKRAEYESWLNRRNDFLDQAEGNLVEIYSTMRPDAAAERLAEVDVELAAAILMKLQAREAGVILNEMDSKAAATLTGIMASAARRQDPT
jgi:flagellar motility protein MotE (MotC chaperone)